MDQKENDLLNGIDNAERDRKHYKDTIRRLQKELADAESYLIEATIRRDRLKENLRVHRITTVKVVYTERERDIDSLRDKLPELMKKIEGEKPLK